MKKLVQFPLIPAFVFVAHFAMAAEPANQSLLNVDSGDRPIGVEAKDWIPVNDKLGFVILKTVKPPTDKTAQQVRDPCTATAPTINLGPPERNCRPALISHVATPPAPAAGYFMIKSDSGWRRLVVMTPADIAVAKN